MEVERQYGFKPEFSCSAPSPEHCLPSPSCPNLYPVFASPVPSNPYCPQSPYNPSPVNQAYRWVDTHAAHGVVPDTAVQGGVDVDGYPIYVGRAYHSGDWIPAKVIPGKQIAYVAYDGEEHPSHQFQVLCEQRFQWAPTQGPQIPHGAVQGGQTSDGEPLYIGRVFHAGSQTVGKVHPSHGVCYIPFDGKEVAYDTYETLVLRA